MDVMERAEKFGPSATEIAMLGTSVLMFLAFVLERYTPWEFGTCLLAASRPIGVAEGILLKVPPRKMAIRIMMSLTIICFGWALVKLLFWK